MVKAVKAGTYARGVRSQAVRCVGKGNKNQTSGTNEPNPMENKAGINGNVMVVGKML